MAKSNTNKNIKNTKKKTKPKNKKLLKKQVKNKSTRKLRNTTWFPLVKQKNNKEIEKEQNVNVSKKQLKRSKINVQVDNHPSTSLNQKESSVTSTTPIQNLGINISNLKTMLNQSLNKNQNESLSKDEKQTESLNIDKKENVQLSLREKMQEKLKAARFRYLNEQMYTTTSRDAQKLFESEPESFAAYHEGYRQQVSRWPLNPLDVIIDTIKKLPKNKIVADFGCGDARLAKSVNQKVHSFDLVASDPNLVTACDMAHTSLPPKSVDIAVFCLSLMGTNLNEYIMEANRVLAIGGIMKVAEVESRFENGVEDFIHGVEQYGFKLIENDLSCNLFYFMDFEKIQHNKKNKKGKITTITLQPCLYKKR